MDTTRKTPRFSTAITMAILITIGLGCLCTPTSLVPTSTPAEPPVITPIPNFPPTPTALPPLPPPTQSPAPNSGGGLDPQGPWLLIESAQGLWAVNQDGSGL